VSLTIFTIKHATMIKLQYYMYKSQSETSRNHEKHWWKAKQQPSYNTPHLLTTHLGKTR